MKQSPTRKKESYLHVVNAVDSSLPFIDRQHVRRPTQINVTIFKVGLF